MKKRRLSIAIVFGLMISLLVGCGTKQAGNMGTIILSVNPSIAVNYDKQGNVSSVKAMNEDGQAILENYTDFEGKEAKVVIADVIKMIGDAGYLIDEVENENRKITIELEDDSFLPNDAFVTDIAKSIKDYLTSFDYTNVIRYKLEASDYLDYSDYLDTDYDDNDDEDTDYDDSDYDDTDYDDDKKPVTPHKPVHKPSKPKDTDYDDSDYNDTDNDDSDYDDVDDTDYDDSDYDDSDYDDSDYGN